MDKKDAQEIIEAVRLVANSITDMGAAPAHDEDGGSIRCLTEAVMMHANAMKRIASAINRLAEAVEEHS